MNKAPKTIINWAWAILLFAITISIAWSIIQPIIGYVVVTVVAAMILIFVVPRIYNRLKESGNLRP